MLRRVEVDSEAAERYSWRMAERKLGLQLLDPKATTTTLKDWVEQAKAKGFSSVTVFSSRVMEATHWLEDSKTQVCAAIGYPWGQMDPDVKRFEVETACENGAQQIEYTPFLPPVLEGDHKRFLRELNDAVEAAEERPLYLNLTFGQFDQLQLATIRNMAEEAKVSGFLVTPSFSISEHQKQSATLELKVVAENLELVRELNARAINHFSLPSGLLPLLG